MLANIQHLLLLDQVWTRQVERRGPRSGEDVRTLGQVAEEMGRLLALIRTDAPLLKQIVEQGADEVYAAFIKQVSDAPLAEKARRRLRATFSTSRALADEIARSVRAVTNGAANEQRRIAEKLRRIAAGQATEGDLSKGTVCGLLVILIALGVILVVAGGLLLGGLSVGYGI